MEALVKGALDLVFFGFLSIAVTFGRLGQLSEALGAKSVSTGNQEGFPLVEVPALPFQFIRSPGAIRELNIANLATKHFFQRHINLVAPQKSHLVLHLCL